MTKGMKKLSALIMALALAFSVTACSGGNNKSDSSSEDTGRTAQEILESNLEKSKDMKDVDMTMAVKYVYETSSEDSSSSDSSSEDSSSQTISMNYDAKISDSGEDNMKMAMEGALSASGVSIDMNIYYSDGYYYLNMMDQKMKQQMDVSNLQKQISSTTSQSQLPVDNYKNIVVSQDDDGNTVLDYELNEDGLNEYIQMAADQISSASGSTASSDDLDGIRISSFSGTRTLDKDDNTLKDSAEFVMVSSSYEGETVTVTMDVTYNNPGKSVTVTLPDDLNDYQESSSISLN
ncbi:MAG TPA: hypothetical protein H9754_12820 [Candidatus Anaerostipes avistercoris]|uniref:Lipoprotein n=1 Tax=Candidatus Anaerostipes avistercoris TaxID=2838462 RepID=A0A9D2PKS7_9FIRM|nr:hypothetical protein [Candidatus Anaerostipes avistercoris]